MASRIKGITIQIDGDTTGLDKALKGVNSSLNETQSSLRDVERLLKLDPSNVTLLQQKQQLLTQAISETKNKLDILKNAEEQCAKAAESGGEREVAQYQAVQREIIATEQKLSKYESSLGEIESAADQAGSAMEEFGNSASDSADELEGTSTAMQVLASEGVQQLCSAVSEACKAFLELGSSTQEYREDMGKLETAFETAGLSTDAATETYKNFYAVLGESDRSVEAVNHLAKLVSSEQDLDTWTTICTGVWGTFGDSLPIEGLTEAANETAKTGQVVGVLADALNWAGVSEDTFNESLALCNDEGERAQLIQDTLNGLYSDAAQNYEENNSSIMENREAQAELNDSMAILGQTIEETLNPVMQTLADLVGAVVGWFQSLPEPIQQAIVIIAVVAGVVAALIPVIVAFTVAQTALDASLLPVIGIIAAIVAAIAIIIAVISNWGAIVEWLKGIWDTVTTSIQTAWDNTVGKIGEGVSNAIEHIREFASNIKEKISTAMDNFKESISTGISNAITFFKELPGKIWEAISGLASSLFNWGVDAVNGFIDGLKSMIQKVKDTAASIADAIAEFLHFSRPDKGPLHEYEKWMPDMVKGLASGIDDNIWRIDKAAQNLASTMAADVNVVAAGGNKGISAQEIYQAVKAGVAETDMSVTISEKSFKRSLRGMGVSTN